jgi:putative ABC transport system permease protein
MWKFFTLILKNMRRNLLRTFVTSAGIMFLVFVVTVIWSVIEALERATSEKKQNLKVVVTERWQIPSRMPYSYAISLSEGAPQEASDYRVPPENSMTWQFFGGSMEQDRSKRSFDKLVFAFALQPEKLTTMMDELDSLPAGPMASFQAVVDKLKETKNGIILGVDKLKAIEKKVGDRIRLYSVNFVGMDLEFEIVGTFPEGRYNGSGAMQRDYLNDALDQYEKTHGSKHPQAARTLALVWLRVPDTAAFTQVAQQIEASPNYSNPAVKCEAASSGVATFLEGYRDMIWGVKWLLSPAIFAVLALITANSISIGVRERRLELAVLKVLGFQPYHILWLVLGEALLIGAGAGLLSGLLTYLLITWNGGINFRIAFFAAFPVSVHALWWGLAIGGLTALAGSIGPALSARSVRVSEVFAKVA